MKLFKKHMALTVRLVLVVTIAASSGLTTIVHHCTMSEMDCCGDSPIAGHNNCGLPGVPSSGTSIRADFTCHTNTIVGGVTIKSGELVKEPIAELSRTAIATSPDGCLRHAGGLARTLLSSAAALYPPSVEKCVLNSSLLI